MSKNTNSVALCSQSLPSVSDGAAVPDWIQLLPSVSGDVETGDARGPYHVSDIENIITASFADADRLPIDENHSIDLAAPKGLPAPARGWITEMQSREDGLWGKVDWNEAGNDLVKTRAYRGISPVIVHDKAKNILRILRASLINKPNLRGMIALNQENDDMPFQETVAKQLGLSDDASETDITAAITALSDKNTGNATALQSSLSEIGVALGVAEDGDTAAILAAASAKSESGDTAAIVELQSELSTITSSLNELRTATSLEKASAFVDGEISKGRVGIKPMRDRYIAMHQKDATGTEELILGMPVLGASGTAIVPPAAKDGEIALNADQSGIATMLGVSVEDYTATLKGEQTNQEAL
jgi:phage I-like protein